MCRFKSVIVLKNGDILHDDYTDSHEDLIHYYGLDDKHEPSLNRFVRVEYAPTDMKDYHNIKKYIMKVDESQVPAWFEDIRESTKDKLEIIISRMILKDTNKTCLLSGCYILAGKTKIGYIKNTRILAMSGSARIGSVSGSARIESVSGSARIGSVSDTARIGSVSDSARIESVFNTASIGYVFGSARIGSVSDSARIEYVSGSARIESVSGSARIGSVYGSARIEYVCGSARIESIEDQAKIINDKRIAVS